MQKLSLLAVALFVCSVLPISAQESSMSVTSFRQLDNDLGARGRDGKDDQNGDRCAIIKIVTQGNDFVFEPDALGIVEAVYKTGEIWLYVPHGARSLTIKHPQLGVLRGYHYPIPVKEACVYEMVLKSAKVTMIVEQEITDQYLVFSVLPADAIVFIDDNPVATTDGAVQKRLSIGEHTYRVEHPDYHTQTGTIEVSVEKTATLEVQMAPAFGILEIHTDPQVNADVYIDNQKVGTTPFVDNRCKSGTHTVRLIHPSYKCDPIQVMVRDGEKTFQMIPLSATFSEVTIRCADFEAEIWVNNEMKGTGTWVGDLSADLYVVEARRASHRNIRQSILVEEKRSLEVLLDAPIPITGMLDISATPIGCLFSIDGVEQGTTPAIIKDLLVGEHTLTVSKADYATITTSILIQENQTATLSYSLVKADVFKITKVEFANIDQEGELISNFGSTLYTDTKYLKPRITFVSGSARSYSLQVKIFNPDGTLSKASGNSNDYSYTTSIDAVGGNVEETAVITGWGNEGGHVYSTSGTYRVEIWGEGKLCASSNVYISPRSTYSSSTSSSYGSSSTRRRESRSRERKGEWYLAGMFAGDIMNDVVSYGGLAGWVSEDSGLGFYAKYRSYPVYTAGLLCVAESVGGFYLGMGYGPDYGVAFDAGYIYRLGPVCMILGANLGLGDSFPIECEVGLGFAL